MRWHIIIDHPSYGREVDRVNAPDRAGAIRAAAIKHNIGRGRVLSAVALPEPKPVGRPVKPCRDCAGTGRRGPSWAKCFGCMGSGRA